MRAVDVVSAPTGDHAGAKLAAAQPSGPVVALWRMHTIDGVIHRGRLTEPHVVVKSGGNRHWRLVAARRIAGQTHLHALEIADAAIAHQLGCVAELHRRALLAADLENPPRSLHRVAQRAALRNGERGRFLQVDVLARAHRVNANQRMPVIRRADDHRIDVLVRQKFVIVRVPRHAVVGLAGLLA